MSCQGFFGTGLKPDVTQYALLMPKVVDNVRFAQSMTYLQNRIGYKFKNVQHLQVLYYDLSIGRLKMAKSLNIQCNIVFAIPYVKPS